MDGHISSPAMFDGVGHGFLGNAIQVSGNGDVLHSRRPLAMEGAVDLETCTIGSSEFFQCQWQSFFLQTDHKEAPRQLAGFGDGLVQELGYSTRLLGLRAAVRGKLALKQVSVERQADQLLAKSVMHVLADASLFEIADLEDLALQAVALGNVASDTHRADDLVPFIEERGLDALEPPHPTLRVGDGKLGHDGAAHRHYFLVLAGRPGAFRWDAV